jgi:phosphatidylglycerophosphate synthase
MISAILGGLAFGATAQWPAWGRCFWIAGAAFVQLRLLANMLDGMVAIQAQRASRLGELYNEVPDRISDAAVLIGLGYAEGSDPVAGYSAATVALFVAYVRAAARVAGAPQDFSGPMAKPQRMFLVTVVGLYSGLAPVTWQPHWLAGHFGLPTAMLAIIFVGGLFTAARRLSRAARHLQQPL